MGARHKLNQAYFNGAVFFAAIMGMLTESWAVFFVILGLSIAIALHSGDIRPDNRRRN